MAGGPREEHFFFAGPAGRLAGRYRDSAPGREPTAAALLCHPHPLYGGTMHNKTLYRIAKRLPWELSIPCLRFDYRGAGESDGEHDHGRGELDDTRAALKELRRRLGAAARVPLIAIGYSFGAAVGLRALADEDRVERLIGLGLPLRFEWDLSFLLSVKQPCLFVQGGEDEFGSPAELARFTARMSAAVEKSVISGASHLFAGFEDSAVEAVVRYLAREYDSDA